MSESAITPRASVIIPTYNRCDELAETLETMTEQDIDPREFEVIVADDGSSDRSAEVARSFAGPLRLKYYFHQDEGFRVAAVRNAGAKLATAPILIFLDSGTLAGPGLVSAHLALHAEGQERRAVMGYCYGYNGFREKKWIPDSFDTHRLTEVMERNKDNPEFADIRERDFRRGGADPMKWPVPWLYFFTMNCSMPTEDYWAVGGFDEMFRSWGVEDVELAYRLYHNGVRLILSRDAWTVEMPTDRPVKQLIYCLMRNGKLFLDKHRDPYIELLSDAYLSMRLTTIFEESYALERWTGEAAGLDVRDEIEALAAGLDPGARLAIFGCGPSVPDWLPPALLADFDAGLLARALSPQAGKHTGLHAIGMRTGLPAGAADVVIVTSRLRGLWAAYGDRITHEAERTGRRVVLAPSLAG